MTLKEPWFQRATERVCLLVSPLSSCVVSRKGWLFLISPEAGGSGLLFSKTMAGKEMYG